MKKTQFIVDGYFSENQAKKIKEKLQGKTYFNFNIGLSNCAGNYKLTVTAENADLEEAKMMFYYVALNEL